MRNLQRLRQLQPWENVSEEDLFRVNGLYLSLRGNVRRPNGLWATRQESRARAWVLEPQQPPAPDDWRLDADSGAFSAGSLSTAEVEAALDLILDDLEGKPSPALEFPITFNLGHLR